MGQKQNQAKRGKVSPHLYSRQRRAFQTMHSSCFQNEACCGYETVLHRMMTVADIYHKEFYSFICLVAKIALSASYFPLQGKIATFRKHGTHAKRASAKCQGVH